MFEDGLIAVGESLVAPLALAIIVKYLWQKLRTNILDPKFQLLHRLLPCKRR